ncbi:barstar family protein [Leadbetterella sp. DM7]|uniref:barstar family protein n=1 Tax=Leadbetterella sp. DM7 TaxID=3235085 RepID=UPI00349ECD4B
MKNIAIARREELPENFEIAEIDASKTTTLREFYETMAGVFEFPDYFGYNLDSFDEMMNDLSWIENEKILIYFTHSDKFLEKERNESKILTLLDLLDATCEEWKWAEADEDIPKKELLVRFSPGERIQRLLE